MTKDEAMGGERCHFIHGKKIILERGLGSNCEGFHMLCKKVDFVQKHAETNKGF